MQLTSHSVKNSQQVLKDPTACIASTGTHSTLALRDVNFKLNMIREVTQN